MHTKKTRSTSDSTTERLANGLGWFSIGLGIAETFAPGGVARLIGAENSALNRGILRFYGMRELAAGMGILTQPQPAGWLWARVAGDAIDLASLGTSLAISEDRGRKTFATAAVLGVTALDVICAQRLTDESGWGGSIGDGKVEASAVIVIDRSPEEIYTFWKNVTNFPRFMRYLDSVEALDERRSHWKARGLGGRAVEWDSEVTHDLPNERISWRSTENADVYNAGTVRFERSTGGRGTLVRVEMQYAPPGGAVTANLARLFGREPGQMLKTGLRELKQILEVGEVVQSDASIHPGMHPAQPPTGEERSALQSDPELVNPLLIPA